VVLKMLKGKSVSNFRQPRDLIYRQSDTPTEKRKLTLFPGDDKEVRLLLMTTMR
jgi:hypothetical protein